MKRKILLFFGGLVVLLLLIAMATKALKIVVGIGVLLVAYSIYKAVTNRVKSKRRKIQ